MNLRSELAVSAFFSEESLASSSPCRSPCFVVLWSLLDIHIAACAVGKQVSETLAEACLASLVEAISCQTCTHLVRGKGLGEVLKNSKLEVSQTLVPISDTGIYTFLIGSRFIFEAVQSLGQTRSSK